MKKMAAYLILICAIAFSSIIVQPVQAAELNLEAESAILVDAHSGQILYEKDPHKKMYPASMTKLMTLVLAMEALDAGKVKLEDVVTASENAASYKGSRIFLSAGEQFTFYEYLLGVALASGNDASVAVAEHIAGSHEGFVEFMNQKAAQLGMKNTNFVNCNGLHDDNHYTTAYDFSLLALEALRFPKLREICTVKHYRIRENTKPFQFDNKNKLLWWYEGADGFKTGWTEDAKYCFTGTAERNGLRFVSVVMGVKQSKGQFRDTMALFNWGYSQYTFKDFYGADESLAQVKVGKGLKDQVNAIPVKKVGLTVKKGEDKNLTTHLELLPIVNAPVKKGQLLGYIAILKDGQELSRTDLVAAEEISKGSWFSEFKKVLRKSLAS